MAGRTSRTRVDRVVALAPVGNLRKAAEHGMGTGAAVDFLGGTPDEVPEVYDAADPATRMRDPPGSRSWSSCTATGRRTGAGAEQPRAAGRFDWLDYRELAGADHFDVIDPASDAWPAVLDAVRG